MNYEKETCDPSQGNAHPILYLGIATHNAYSFLTHEQKPPFEARHGIDMKTLGFLFFFSLPSFPFLPLPATKGWAGRLFHPLDKSSRKIKNAMLPRVSLLLQWKR